MHAPTRSVFSSDHSHNVSPAYVTPPGSTVTKWWVHLVFSTQKGIWNTFNPGVLDFSAALCWDCWGMSRWVSGMKSWPIIIPRWSLTWKGQAWTAGATSRWASLLHGGCHTAKLAPLPFRACRWWLKGEERCQKNTTDDFEHGRVLWQSV